MTFDFKKGPKGDTGDTGETGATGAPGSSAWGSITGTLAAQTDLATALGLRLLASDVSVGGTLAAADKVARFNGSGDISTMGVYAFDPNLAINPASLLVDATSGKLTLFRGTSKVTIRPNTMSFDRDIVMPSTSGTLALANGNITGTAAGLSSTLDIASGGTGQTTATAATNALLPSQAGNSGKVLSTNGTDTSWATVATGITIGTTTANGTAGRILYTDGANVQQYAVTGTGDVVRATSPTLVTPNLGTPSSGVVTNLTGTASININGTVGATTPASGAFTSIGINGAIPSANSNFATTSSTTNYLEVKTTSTATQAAAGIFMENSTSHGILYKAATGYTTYKNIAANDLGFYNNNIGGNISILNDHTSGNISFAAGGSSTAHLTIASTGVVNMTGGLTISSTTSLLLGTAGSAVGTIGFRNGTSGTATLEPPTGALGTYTVTLPGVASTLATLGANTFNSSQTISSGSLTLPTTLAFTTGANSLIADSTGITYFSSGSNRIRFDYNQLQLCQSAFLSFSTGTAFSTGDLILSRAATSPTASLQLGANHATAATNQTFKSHNVTTGTGGKLTLGGGTGSVAGGAVALATSATTGALVEHLLVRADGVIDFASAALTTESVTSDRTLTVRVGGTLVKLLVKA